MTNSFALIFCYIILARFVGCKSWWYTSILGFGLGLIWAYKKSSIDKLCKQYIYIYKHMFVYCTI